MADEIETAINDIKVILTQITGEINVGEERLANKATKLELHQEIQVLEDKLYASIRSVEKTLKADIKELNDKVTGIYIKVAGFSGIVVGIIELIAAMA